ncbi:hypothetical protein [Nonomuraea candida]|uniref:hypothetical protein n=1 Tax=Nonomuraea candida TaxID=359159 RepID=UPI001B80A9B6|nr:hypothetical protein [Nonomuraea candida]
MKARALTALAAMVLATGAPPILLEALDSGHTPILGSLNGGGPPLVDVQTMVQHVNVLTS